MEVNFIWRKLSSWAEGLKWLSRSDDEGHTKRLSGPIGSFFPSIGVCALCTMEDKGRSPAELHVMKRHNNFEHDCCICCIMIDPETVRDTHADILDGENTVQTQSEQHNRSVATKRPGSIYENNSVPIPLTPPANLAASAGLDDATIHATPHSCWLLWLNLQSQHQSWKRRMVQGSVTISKGAARTKQQQHNTTNVFFRPTRVFVSENLQHRSPAIQC